MNTTKTASVGKQVKILCAGDVNGNFKQLIARVSSVDKKAGPFDVLFCVGEFFGPNDEENQRVVDGELQFPIPTYILGPCCPSTSSLYPEESSELSQTLTYLGRKGILTTANGLMVAYFSGIEASQGQPANAFQFDNKFIDDLLMPVSANSGFLGVDLLLTSIWPTDLLACGRVYHFAGQGIHYERSPYRNHRVLLESAQHVTRFIGLAPVDNSAKQKWLYAFTCTPMRYLSREELVVQPDNCTEFPYMEVLQEFMRQRAIEEEQRRIEAGTSAQFFYDMQSDPNEQDSVDRGGRRGKRPYGNDSGGGQQQPRKPRIDPNTCWFCLSNVGAEKHLILSIGTHCYAAMPKGPLNERHLLVMSISHIKSLIAAPAEVRDEITKFKDAYSLFCDRNNEVLCVFERNYKTEHLQMQFVPVPKTKAKAMRSTFLNLARLKNIEFTFLNTEEQIWDLLNESSPYFYVEFPDGTRMLSRSMAQFPIQFGREVLASKALLDCEDKVDWRNCSLGKEKEAELVNRMKEGFRPFDFTNADSDDED